VDNLFLYRLVVVSVDLGKPASTSCFILHIPCPHDIWGLLERSLKPAVPTPGLTGDKAGKKIPGDSVLHAGHNPAI